MFKTDIGKIPDEKLVELVRLKNKELYSEIVKRYQDKLLRYVGYLLKNDNDTQDVVQNSFIKTYKNLFKFDVKRKFSSWIYRIVHNEAMNYVKWKKKEISLEVSNDFSVFLIGDEDIELDFEKKEIKSKVQKCLTVLPVKYKVPLVLFFLEEKSYDEISDILRMPIGTVGTRINRGKLLLRKICNKKGGKQYVK